MQRSDEGNYYFNFAILSLADLAREASGLNGEGHRVVLKGIQKINSLSIPVWRGRLKPGQEDKLFILEEKLSSVSRYDLNELLSNWQNDLNPSQQDLVSRYWNATKDERRIILAGL